MADVELYLGGSPVADLREKIAKAQGYDDDGHVIARGVQALLGRDADHLMGSAELYHPIVFRIGDTALLDAVDVPVLATAFGLAHSGHAAVHAEGKHAFELGSGGWYLSFRRLAAGARLEVSVDQSSIDIAHRRMILEVFTAARADWADLKPVVHRFATDVRQQVLEAAPQLAFHPDVGPWLASRRVAYPLRRIYGVPRTAFVLWRQ